VLGVYLNDVLADCDLTADHGASQVRVDLRCCDRTAGLRTPAP